MVRVQGRGETPGGARPPQGGGPFPGEGTAVAAFLPLLDSTRSPEEEERMEDPPKDKGKGRAPASEEVQGEVTGVVCDLCDKKGVPCRWGKVSFLFSFVYCE